MIREKHKQSIFGTLSKKANRWRQRVLHRLVEAKLIHNISDAQYREKVIGLYSGHRGALLAGSSRISGHFRNGESVFKERQFDLRGTENILDIGSGSGPILSHLIQYADIDTKITGIDISSAMISRARKRLASPRPHFVLGDLAQLPFRDEAFDCITCCYALEHVPDTQRGMEEISRVLIPGGRVLLFVTEDTFIGAWTSRFWKCRTHNRVEFYNLCKSLQFEMNQEFWFTRFHRLLRVGGICVELVKRPAASTAFLKSDPSTDHSIAVDKVPAISAPN